jgi:hypothetical protein
MSLLQSFFHTVTIYFLQQQKEKQMNPNTPVYSAAYTNLLLQSYSHYTESEIIFPFILLNIHCTEKFEIEVAAFNEICNVCMINYFWQNR